MAREPGLRRHRQSRAAGRTGLQMWPQCHLSHGGTPGGRDPEPPQHPHSGGGDPAPSHSPVGLPAAPDSPAETPRPLRSSRLNESQPAWRARHCWALGARSARARRAVSKVPRRSGCFQKIVSDLTRGHGLAGKILQNGERAGLQMLVSLRTGSGVISSIRTMQDCEDRPLTPQPSAWRPVSSCWWERRERGEGC